MNALEIFNSTKDHLDASDSFWSGAQIWRRMDEAQREILRHIIREQPSFYIASTNVDFVSGQAEYTLPLNARRGSRIIVAGNNQVSPTATIIDADIRQIFDAQDSTVINLTQDMRFLLVNGKLRVLPTPGSTTSSALIVYYMPSFGNMIYGTASAGDTAELTPFTSDANYTTNFGWIDTRDDYYNGMELLLISGTGAGQYRLISDYNGSTTAFTVDSAWDTAPSTDTVFSVQSPVPEDNHDAVSMSAALRCSVKGRTRYRELHRSYYGSRGQTGVLKELLAWVGQREVFRQDQVVPADYGD
jgi:hypothetical protein